MTSAGPQPASPDRWQRVKEVLNAALDLEPKQRAAYLVETCGEDTLLREEVTELLASYDDAGDEFLDRPTGETSALEAFARSADPLVGKQVGPYKIVDEVGHGGMGSVYKAFRADDPKQQPVAVKIIRSGMSTEYVVRRFKHERQALAALDHPNVAKLLDGGVTEDGLPFFVMEHIDGRPIDAYCDENRLSIEARLRIFQQICSGVQAAHDRRIIHRDIKPGNILVDESGCPKLLDFGIAKILDPELSTQTMDPTATVLRLMTPEYASPEQVCGEPVTAASDVYSLGVLLYELLTGHRPYRVKRRSAHEIAKVICDSEPDRPSTAVGRTEVVTRGMNPAVTLTPDAVSRVRGANVEELRRILAGSLDSIILMALRKEPARRYKCASDMRDDIGRYLEGRAISARHDTWFYRASKQLRRNRKLVLVGSLAMMLGTGAMIAWDYFRSETKDGLAPTATAPLTSFPGDETQPSFSPDGGRAAFVWGGENNDNSDIYVREMNSGSVVRLTTNAADDFSPVWSPEGKRVAFLRVAPKLTEVFIAPFPSGVHGAVTSVYPTRIEAVGKHLDWSPDGKYLAAADKKTADEPFSIYLIETATGHKIQVTAPPTGMIGDMGPAFSPDGKWIAFIRAISGGVDDIFIAPADGTGEARRVTSDRRYIISLTWAPDGKSIVFSSNRTGAHMLWRVDPAGGQIERISAVAENVSDPVFSRDGKLLAFSQFYVDTNIWQADAATGKQKRYIVSTQHDSSPAFSPDGRKVAFRSNRSGPSEIWVADQQSPSLATQLTQTGGTSTGAPRWSPDGTRIAFESNPIGAPDIYVVDTGSRIAKRLTDTPSEDASPSWSRDGQWLYFASNRGGSSQIWKVPASGGAAVRVTTEGGFAPMESDDGKFVYYAKGRTVAGLWRVPTAGGAEEAVLPRLKPGYWGYWALCRQSLYFIDKESPRSPASLFAFEPGSGKLSRLFELSKPLAAAEPALSMSPDCSTVLFAQRDQSGSDLMLVELAGK
ncbi:MAG TPA: protein kinase [Bryobacteraceae bacterium]|nr:protein kinase [Bryobacteraceae bacterium]